MTGVLALASAVAGCAVAANVDARLSQAEPQTSLSRFENYLANARRDVFVANTNFWARGVDFSCASPWNSDRGQLKAGTLISRRHVIFAKHFPLKVGTRLVFVGKDGGVCPLYLDATKEIANADLTVGLLNAEVTPEVTPAKILPPDYATYIGDGRGLPTVTLTQGERAYVNELNAISTDAAVRTLGSHAPDDAQRRRFRDRLIVGDSGNPAFLLVGDEPVLLYCLTTGGAGAGSAVHRYRNEIQRAMDELCAGYKLESVDFKKDGNGTCPAI